MDSIMLSHGNGGKLTNDLIENKKALGDKFKIFLTACDDYMNRLV